MDIGSSLKNESGQHPHSILTRSNLRNIVILLSYASSLVFAIDSMRMVFSIMLLVLGSFVHVVSKGILVRNRVLCGHGIYGIVRHPYYIANYLIDSGFCLLSGNPYLLVLYPFLFFWAYGPTLRKEEEVLAAIHGEAFSRYASDVPQVFPGPWSVRGWQGAFEGFLLQRITRKEVARIMRFLAVALMIMVFHSVENHGLRWFTSTGVLHDPATLILLSAAILIYAVSVFVLRRREATPGGLSIASKGTPGRASRSGNISTDEPVWTNRGNLSVLSDMGYPRAESSRRNR